MKNAIILDENRYKNRYNQIDKQARSCKLLKVGIRQRPANRGFPAIFQLFRNFRSSPAKRVWGETSTEGSNPSLSAISIKTGPKNWGPFLFWV